MVSIELILSEGVEAMISIDRFSIKGFRNIKDIDLQLGKITSLLALNNYGKSNVIKAVKFGIDFITRSYERDDMVCWISGVPFNKGISKKVFEFEMEFSFQNQKVIYGYSFGWVSKKGNGKIKTEYLRVKEKNSQKYTQYIDRNLSEAFYKASKTAACTKQTSIGDRELVINKLLAFDSLFYLDLIRAMNDIKVYIEKHFDASRNYNVSPFVTKDDSISGLLREGNIPRILYVMKKDYPEKYELIINTYKELFPSIEDMQVHFSELDPNEMFQGKISEQASFKAADTLYNIFVKDKNLDNIIPFDFMSEGAKKILLIFTYLTLAGMSDCSFIMIEEPENSVHPQLLHQYLIALDGFIGHSKLLITSHSPYLTNYLDPTNLYVGLPNDKGLACFYKIKDTAAKRLMKNADDMDVLTGEYLFDLMTGTKEDIEELKSYVEK